MSGSRSRHGTVGWTARLLNAAGRSPFGGPLSRAHAALYRWTKGRFLPIWFGAPVMVLEVRGRKSGKPRRVPVVYAARPPGYIVIAANGGATRPPRWGLNLAAAGEAVVYLGGRAQGVRARRVEGAERQLLWDEYKRTYPDLDAYTEFTSREFPVFELIPEEPSKPRTPTGA